MSEAAPEEPRGELTTSTMAMPKDTNPSGDIFGGWLMSEMDIAGGIAAWRRARGRVATVAVRAMAFHLPVHVGDVHGCYTASSRWGPRRLPSTSRPGPCPAARTSGSR